MRVFDVVNQLLQRAELNAASIEFARIQKKYRHRI